MRLTRDLEKGAVKMPSTESFLHMSIIEEIQQRAIAQGIKDHFHHFPLEEQLVALAHVFSSRYLPKYRFGNDVKAVPELDQLKIDSPPMHQVVYS